MHIVKLEGEVVRSPCLAATSLPTSINLQIEVVVGDLVTLVQTAIALGSEPFLTVVVDKVIEDLNRVTGGHSRCRILSDVVVLDHPAWTVAVLDRSLLQRRSEIPDDKSPHRNIRRSREHRIAVNRVGS